MKVKSDFVTNSSSTNFCIIGIRSNSYDLADGKEKNEIYDLIEEYVSKLDLVTYIEPNDNIIYIGKEINNELDENKTIKQIKEEVAEKLKKLDEKCNFKSKLSNIELGVIIEGWYDG